MLPRILGALVLLVGLVLASFAVYALSAARDMSELIGLSSPPGEAEIESARWLEHWRLSSSVMLISGLLLVTSGVGLLLRRRRSVLLLAAVAALLALQDLVFAALGWARYAFEVPEAGEVLFLFVVAISCVFAYRRWRPASQS